ncbi:cation-translocating P-type ATPase [candidate division TA06 bacterium]|nr:cation-translocating P-type ATPase [candidate division TA06 bacterium]
MDKEVKGKTKLVMSVEGMHCADCALNIERSIQHLSGVLEATVDYINQRAVVDYDPYRIEVDQIKRAVLKPGYLIRETPVLKTRSFFLRYRHLLMVGGIGLFLLFAWLSPQPFKGFFAFLGAILGLFPILRNAIKTLLSFDVNTNVLVSIAVIAALFIGAYVEGAIVVWILLLGEALEGLTVAKTRKAFSTLMDLAPEKATVRRDGKEMEIPVREVVRGDCVIIKPGERIPADGIIQKGKGAVSEAFLTGESIPIEKEVGDKVYTATVNDSGTFEMEAVKVGEETTFARVKRLIQDAQSKKAPIQRTIDRFARLFVPLSLLTAILVFFLTGEMRRAITILIVACPCAFVLGTPTAVIAGIGRAARKGILIKGGPILEGCGRLNAFLFDKTGTLTHGNPRVVKIHSFDHYNEAEVLRLAGMAELRSEHPFARAILSRAREDNLDLPLAESYEIKKGKGVTATYDGELIVIGNPNYLKEKGITIEKDIKGVMEKEEGEGRTLLFVAHSNSSSEGPKLCGLLSIFDPPREDARKMINEIQGAGVRRIALLTGDRPGTARAVAKSVGIEEVYSELLPEEKMERVKSFRRAGYTVGMMGDGVNDGPALAAADIGFAMGVYGTEVALETADIALMSDDLGGVSRVIGLSRKALSIIHQNLFFTIGLSILLVVITSFGLLPMVGGAVMHEASSLVVILNSMRLLRYGMES